MNDLIDQNSVTGSKFYLNPKGGRTITHVEYFVIIRDPPKGGYKSGKENQIRGWNKNWGKDT